MHLHMIIVSNMTRILADLDCTIHVRKVHRWVSIGLVSEQEFGPGAILTKNSSKTTTTRITTGTRVGQNGLVAK